MNITDYQCEFKPSPRDEALRELAQRYHDTCEAYDRTVCTGQIVHGGIMPASNHERKLINRNARAVWDAIRAEADQRGISRQELWAAIGRYSN